MWWKILIVILVAILLIYAVGFLYGAVRWKGRTEEVRGRLDAARAPALQGRVDFGELEGLPEPVQRYLRRVLVDGEPVVTDVELQHTGTFNMSETEEEWKSFSSEQWVSTTPPGFLWNAKVDMLPGLPVRVHDAFIAGEGLLQASLLGLVSVASMEGTGRLAEGELMRYLAEAVWYPTTLLPSQGVTWKGRDEGSAYATLTTGETSVTMLFTFNDAGLIESVHADARTRTVDGTTMEAPWQGRHWNYEERNGMLIPLDGEVAWLLPEGELAYWRGHVVTMTHCFAR